MGNISKPDTDGSLSLRNDIYTLRWVDEVYTIVAARLAHAWAGIIVLSAHTPTNDNLAAPVILVSGEHRRLRCEAGGTVKHLAVVAQISFAEITPDCTAEGVAEMLIEAFWTGAKEELCKAPCEDLRVANETLKPVPAGTDLQGGAEDLLGIPRASRGRG